MAATDLFGDEYYNFLAPAYNGEAVAPDDANDLTLVTRAIYVGGAGDVKVDLPGRQGEPATTVTFKAVPVGTLLPIAASRVYATGTTATNLVALR